VYIFDSTCIPCGKKSGSRRGGWPLGTYWEQLLGIPVVLYCVTALYWLYDVCYLSVIRRQCMTGHRFDRFANFKQDAPAMPGSYARSSPKNLLCVPWVMRLLRM
jgi:hypothetical protein